MRILLSFLLSLFYFVPLKAQNNSFIFNGSSSNVNIGNSAGDGIRTFEMWVQPNQLINSQLQEYSVPLFRNTERCNNCDEFGFFFKPSYAPNPGYLGFKVHSSGNGNTKYEVLSDSNSWQIGKWYHLAAVLDSTQGLKLFINGVQQQSVDPGGTFAATSSSAITTIGCQGDRFDRNFNGRIDAVRLSTNAVYTQNFIPQCTYPITANTRAVYYLDQIVNNAITYDSSINAFHGIVNRLSLSGLNACVVVGLGEKKEGLSYQIGPNPFNEYIKVELENYEPNSEYVIQLFNSNGQLVSSARGLNSRIKISTAGLSEGIYFLSLFKNGKRVISEKMVHQKF